MNDILLNLWVWVYDKGAFTMAIFCPDMDAALMVIDKLPRKQKREYKIH